MKVLVFSAHPDDVEFGMGSTISKFTKMNIPVSIVISFFFNSERRQEAILSLSKLGVRDINIFFTSGKDHRDIVSEYDSIISNVIPTNIFTHFYGDSHQEHKIVYECAITTLRKLPTTSCLLWENNQPGAHTHEKFSPIIYVSVDRSDFDAKISSLMCHETQMKKYNTDLLFKFLEHKALINGYNCGSVFAEVFFPIKMIMEL